MKILKYTGIAIIIAIVALSVLIYSINYYPKPIEIESVTCPIDTPLIKQNQKLKIMSWNVQYMASKNYVFFYDMEDNRGPDNQPSSEHIAQTLSEVTRIINDEKPDVVLLQEVDYKAKRTNYEDQIKLLLEQLSKLNNTYPCYSSTYYWKSLFIPHPRIVGSVGMKLLTMSKYKIDTATRYALEQMPADIVSKQFHLKRAILETVLPIENQTKPFYILNTHFEAFSVGTNTLSKQVEQTMTILDNLTKQNKKWIIGGDFNLLPSKKQYNQLEYFKQKAYNPNSELLPLISKYSAIPSLEEATGNDMQLWFTHFPNDPRIHNVDRTIDYIFTSHNIKIGDHFVRQKDTLKISDHVPIVTEIILNQ